MKPTLEEIQAAFNAVKGPHDTLDKRYAEQLEVTFRADERKYDHAIKLFIEPWLEDLQVFCYSVASTVCVQNHLALPQCEAYGRCGEFLKVLRIKTRIQLEAEKE